MKKSSKNSSCYGKNKDKKGVEGKVSTPKAKVILKQEVKAKGGKS